MSKIALDQKQRNLVLQILKRHFPSEHFFVFGSRATLQNLKPFSDLDIAIQGEDVLSTATLARAKEDFSASDLPFKVDLVDLRAVPEFLRESVQKDQLELR